MIVSQFTWRARKRLLRKMINELSFPIHCTGCDEWRCGGEEESGTFHEIDDEQLDKIWDVISKWCKDER